MPTKGYCDEAIRNMARIQIKPTILFLVAIIADGYEGSDALPTTPFDIRPRDTHRKTIWYRTISFTVFTCLSSLREVSRRLTEEKLRGTQKRREGVDAPHQGEGGKE